MIRHPLSFRLLQRVSIAAILFCSQAYSQNAAEDSPLRVGVKVAPPFVMAGEDGEWEGIAVDLWRLVAADMGKDFTLIEKKLPGLLDSVETGELDLGIGAITVTNSREEQMDFSQPYDFSGIGVAARIGDQQFTRLLRSFISLDFLKAIAALCLVLTLAGAAVWYAEKRKDSESFGEKPLEGIGNGFWWAAVTMTTVGYGDKAPSTLAGRIVGLIWMFIGVITISGFTAAIASTLTASSLNGSLKDSSDLDRVRIGAVTDTVAADVLKSRGFNFRPFPNYQDALKALNDGAIGAVVHDQPLLVYEVKKSHYDDIEILNWLIAQQSYAFALPTDSPLRESLNRSLLKIMGSPEWTEIRRKYLGARHEN